MWEQFKERLTMMIECTRKNDLTRHVTHIDAVFGTAIHIIYDAWHYKAPWTWALTRLLWSACDYVRFILYIMLHTTNLKPNCQMHCLAHSQVSYEVHFWLRWIAHSQTAQHTLSRRSRLNSEFASKYFSEYILKYTPRHALKDAPNCTWWHTHSLLDCMLPSQLTRCSEAYSKAHSQIQIQLHSMVHSQDVWYTLQSTLEIHCQVHSRACSQGRFQLHSMSHSQPDWQYAPKYSLKTLLSIPLSHC